MALNRFMEMTRSEENESDRQYCINLRVDELINDGFHRDNALRLAQKEWEDGFYNVDVCDLD